MGLGPGGLEHSTLPERDAESLDPTRARAGVRDAAPLKSGIHSWGRRRELPRLRPLENGTVLEPRRGPHGHALRALDPPI
jgi:hypothetical protein